MGKKVLEKVREKRKGKLEVAKEKITTEAQHTSHWYSCHHWAHIYSNTLNTHYATFGSLCPEDHSLVVGCAGNTNNLN